MSQAIKDGTGTGYHAAVNNRNQLLTESVSQSIQHYMSLAYQRAYQAGAVTTIGGAGTIPCLVLTNNHASRRMCVTYIRWEVIDPSGGTAYPSANSYMGLQHGQSRASGGTEVTPVNMYIGDGAVSGVTVYADNTTMTGTAVEIDRWYPKAEGEMNTWNKEGALIVPPGESIDLAYTTDNTGGLVYTRVSFIMRDAA